MLGTCYKQLGQYDKYDLTDQAGLGNCRGDRVQSMRMGFVIQKSHSVGPTSVIQWFKKNIQRSPVPSQAFFSLFFNLPFGVGAPAVRQQCDWCSDPKE